MKHHLAITVKILPATNTKESRVSLSSPRLRKRRVFGWDHGQGHTSADQAVAQLTAAGMEVDAILDMDSHYILTVADWNAGRKFFGVE